MISKGIVDLLYVANSFDGTQQVPGFSGSARSDIYAIDLFRLWLHQSGQLTRKTMTHFLFAGNNDNIKGGADDLVGSYCHLDDQTVFVAVMDEIYVRRIQPAARIWADAFSCEINALGPRQHWEFRMATSLDDPSLKFCSYKADAAGVGPCGVIPLGRRVERVVDANVSVFYALTDPEQENIDTV
jgi:hypothetical protein